MLHLTCYDKCSRKEFPGTLSNYEDILNGKKASQLKLVDKQCHSLVQGHLNSFGCHKFFKVGISIDAIE